jgi:hypothetical protein
MNMVTSLPHACPSPPTVSLRLTSSLRGATYARYTLLYSFSCWTVCGRRHAVYAILFCAVQPLLLWKDVEGRRRWLVANNIRPGAVTCLLLLSDARNNI